jgi:hypothetical protein
MTGDGVVDLTPDGSDVTLPLPPRHLAAVPAPEAIAADDPQAVVVPTVTLRGREFPIRQQGIGLLSLMKFATLAKRGKIDSEDLEGLVALYDLLSSSIDPAAWPEFEAYANSIGASGEELIVVVKEAVQAKSARPTQPLSGSPDGQLHTGPSSAGDSSSPDSFVPTGSLAVQQQYEAAGRPDIAQAVKRAREASTRSSTG